MSRLASGWRLWRISRPQTALAGSESFEGSTLLPAPGRLFIVCVLLLMMFVSSALLLLNYVVSRNEPVRSDRDLSVKALSDRLVLTLPILPCRYRLHRTRHNNKISIL